MKGYSVEKFKQDEVAVVRVEGEVDLANVDRLDADLSAAIPNTLLGVVVDLSATAYLDSTGIRLLLDLRNRLHTRQQTMRLVAPTSSIVRRVLELTYVDETIPIDCSVDEALSRLGTGSPRAGDGQAP